MIEEIENISHLSELEEFWVSLSAFFKNLRIGGDQWKEGPSTVNTQASGNKIANLRALDTQLAPLKKLETVYLEGNPCQQNDMSGYRRKIILALPQVKQIDATYVVSRFLLQRNTTEADGSVL